MSVVYKVRHTVLHRIYAIKMLLPQLAINPKNLKRFEQEARAASALNHPNVIAIHDFGASPQGQPYLVMDYLEGQGLNELIKNNSPLDVDRSLGIFIQACDALALAHETGIVHRDLKPSNIMVTKGGPGEDQVKIVDFGIAKLLPTEGEDVQRLTQTGEVFGSPYYMSPEQWTGKALDARSDIYSMGCVMYETLAGHAPFAGSTVHETMYKLMNEVPAGLTKLQASAEIRAQLEAILFKAIARDPAQRYQSMRDLKADLEKVRHGGHGGLLSRIRNLWVVSRLRRVPARTRSTVVAHRRPICCRFCLARRSKLSLCPGIRNQNRFPSATNEPRRSRNG
jgi:serine/threonine-protein kinase